MLAYHHAGAVNQFGSDGQTTQQWENGQQGPAFGPADAGFYQLSGAQFEVQMGNDQRDQHGKHAQHPDPQRQRNMQAVSGRCVRTLQQQAPAQPGQQYPGDNRGHHIQRPEHVKGIRAGNRNPDYAFFKILRKNACRCHAKPKPIKVESEPTTAPSSASLRFSVSGPAG